MDSEFGLDRIKPDPPDYPDSYADIPEFFEIDEINVFRDGHEFVFTSDKFDFRFSTHQDRDAITYAIRVGKNVHQSVHVGVDIDRVLSSLTSKVFEMGHHDVFAVHNTHFYSRDDNDKYKLETNPNAQIVNCTNKEEPKMKDFQLHDKQLEDPILALNFGGDSTMYVVVYQNAIVEAVSTRTNEAWPTANADESLSYVEELLEEDEPDRIMLLDEDYSSEVAAITI